jgi:predicted ArsR family transcriptional regulator
VPEVTDHQVQNSGDERFSATVAAVTAAFGDPTRREIYLFVRTNPGCTASQVAASFSLHPNVARHHLDRLSAGGYLQVSLQRSAGGGGGRPSKSYRVSPNPDSDQGGELFIETVVQRDSLLVSLLAEALEMIGPDQAEQMAERIGKEHGRAMAGSMEPGDGQRSVRAAMHAVADALTARGFNAHAEDRGTTTAVVAENCPFGEAASVHPVLCSVDRGIVRGLLEGLCSSGNRDMIPVVISSRARGDEDCSALA